jgi:HK97 family phage portal protein
MNLLSLFKRGPKQQAAVIEIQNSFTAFSGGAFNSPVFRAAVDAVARHAAKLCGHSDDKSLETLLTASPNPYMSAFDMLYRVTASYYTSNNAFCLIDREGGIIRALYPLTPSSVEFEATPDGALYAKMRFSDGREVLLAYSDLVHIRRHYYGGNNELTGADNCPLFGLIDTADTLQQGISARVKNGTSIKGVLKFTSLVNPAQLKAEKQQFIQDYFNVSNSGGIAATDQRFDFVPTNIIPYTVPADTLNAVNAGICAFIGISPKIVTGDYSEDEFSAFYESCIEPLALQLSLEFSRKCGVAVTFTSERLEFASAATRIKLIHEAAPLGVLTVNECRKLLALPPIEGGEKTLQSLNYVNAAKADKYQLESEVQEND